MPKELWQLLGLYLLMVNLTGFCMMGLDKWKAKRGAWRIPEKSLFLPAILGGAPGGILGMRVFRHKTRHWYFRWGMPAILLGQILLCAWLAWRGMK